MLQQLFGAELDFSVRLAISLIVIAALLGATVLVLRRLGALPRRGAGRAGRSGPRLAIVDAISIDQRRRLVLVRRDDVEHLLLTGGSNDVVVEPNITGGYVATAGIRPALPLERETAPAAPPAVAAPTAKPVLTPRPEAAALSPAAPRPETAALPPMPSQSDSPSEGFTGEARRLSPVTPDQLAAFSRPMAPRLAEPRPTPSRLEPSAPDSRLTMPLPRPEQASRPQLAEPQSPAMEAPAPVVEMPEPAARGAALESAMEPAPMAPSRAEEPEAAATESPSEAPKATTPVRPELPAGAEVRQGRRALLRETRLNNMAARQSADGSATEKTEDAAERPAPRRAARAAEPVVATESKAAAFLATVERRKAHALALQRRLESLPESEKAATRETINRINQQVGRLLKEAERAAAAEKQEAAAAAALAPVADAAAREEATTAPIPAAPVEVPTEPAHEAVVTEVAVAEVSAVAEHVSVEAVAKQEEPAPSVETPTPEAAVAETVAAPERVESLEDRIAAALQPAVIAPSAPPVEPVLRPTLLRPAAVEPVSAPVPSVTPAQPAVEPRLKEMAQRLDAALSQPSENKLHLSLSDLLDDIEGAAADTAAPPAQPERPRIAMAPRAPQEPSKEAPREMPRSEPRPAFGSLRSRFASTEPAPPRPDAAESAPPRTPLFGSRANPRLERNDEPTARPIEPAPRPYRPAEPYRPAAAEPAGPVEPLAPRPREPFLAPRRPEPAPPRPETDPNAVKFEPRFESRYEPRPEPKLEPKIEPKDKAGDGKEPLDDFDAEMASLLGRTPSR